MIKLGSNNIGKIYLGSYSIGKAYLGSDLVYQSGPALPDGPLEYIKTDGSAFIDTGIEGKWPRSCELKVLIVNTDFACFLGARVGADGRRFQPVMNASNRVDIGTSNSYFNGVSIEESIANQTPVVVRAMLHNATGSYIEAKQEGESSFTRKTITSYPGGGGPTTGLNLFLFANNYGSSAVDNVEPSGTRLYYCKIYSDDSLTNLIFDGVPYRYQGKCGLWDNVSNTFFGNANSSGAFRGGENLEPEPEPVLPYTPIEYVETDGIAYINTGILGNDPRSAEVKFMPTLKAPQVILGTTNGVDGDAKTYAMLQVSSSGTLHFSHYYIYTSSSPSIENSINNATPFVAKVAFKQSSQVLQVKQEGEVSFTSFSKANENTVTTGNPMYLFANYGESEQGATKHCNTGSRLYYCKIYSDNTYTTLVRDFIPCVYQSEYGLWDKVSNSFFGNAAGSGTFSGPSNS